MELQNYTFTESNYGKCFMVAVKNLIVIVVRNRIIGKLWEGGVLAAS